MHSVGADAAGTTAVAAIVLLTAVVANLAGVRASAALQHAGVWILAMTALALAVGAMVGASPHATQAVLPDEVAAGPLLAGVLLAFWAFAGFENLTFLNGELADPRRDFLPVSAMALATYSLLTVLLTVAIGTRIPRGDVDPVTGLLQLAQLLHPRHLVVGVVTVIAICAMTLNAVAWVWGISRLIVGAAHATIVPQWLSVVTTGGVPRRAVLLLGALLAAGTTVLALHPDAVVEAVAAASAIFVVLCVMSIVAYVRVRRLTARTALNVPVLVMVVISLVQSGWRASYAVVTLAAAVIWQLSRSTRVRTATHLGDAFTRAPTTQGRRHPT